MKNALRLVCLSLLLLLVSTPTQAVLDELPIKLDFKFVERGDLNKILAEEYAVLNRIMLGNMARMFDLQIWVFEIEGDIDAIFANTDWGSGANVVAPKNDHLNFSIDRIVNSYGTKLEQEWGSGWTPLAKKKIEEYKGRTVRQGIVTFTPGVGSFDVYTLTFMTPYVSMRNFEITNGLFLIVSKMGLKL